MTIPSTVEQTSKATPPAGEASLWLRDVLRESHAGWLHARVDELKASINAPIEDLELSVVGALGRGSGRDAAFGRELAAFRNRSLRNGSHPYLLLRALRIPEPEGDRRRLIGVAVSVDAEGRRELVGLCTLSGSARRTWPQFLNDLVRRGLFGVKLVVTDDQGGLAGAVTQKLPGAVILKSREAVHRDVLEAVSASKRRMVRILVNSIYSQPGPADARAQYVRVVDQVRSRSPEAAQRLTAASDLMNGFNAIPDGCWQRVWPVLFPVNSKSDRIRVTRLQSNFFVVAPSAHGGGGAMSGTHPRVIEGIATPVTAPAKPPAWKPWRTWRRPTLKTSRLANILALPSAVTAEREVQAGRREVGWPTAITVGGIAIVGLIAHTINLFSFPRYELDEGTYMSSAWAVLNDQITAYPYGYGHPPLGWIQIAVWTQLSGGFFAFGNALNSGRVLMVLLDAGASLFVYLIAQHITGRRAIGILAMVIFSLSPLSLVYQRQVFLDNIAVFWMLFSIYLLTISKSRMRFLVGAGFAFGCALLSKETIALFIPVMVYGLWLNLSSYQRLFGMVTFTYTVIALGFSLVLLALIKGELFPYAWHLPWDHHPHLSLLDTLSVQVHRSQSEGSLGAAWTAWTNGDPWLMALSVVAPIFNLVVGMWKRERLFVALVALSYWALLVRGGVVLPFYVIVLIPLVAINAALAIETLVHLPHRFGRANLLATAVVGCLAVTIAATDFSRSDFIFTQHPTTAQSDAMVWIRQHVPHDSVVVVNSYLYVDLRQPGGEGVGDAASYPFAHVYWNLAYDPELHDGLLKGNWDRIDYIVADSEMLHDIATLGGPMTVISVALQHSILLQEFRQDDNEALRQGADNRYAQLVISIYEVMHEAAPPSPFNRS